MGSPAYEQAFKIGTTESVSNPYTISVPYPAATRYKAGETLDFAVILFGNAGIYGPDFVKAANDMCHEKLMNCTLANSELVFDRVWSDAGAENIPLCDEVLIKFMTPTEILVKKQAVCEIDFEAFVDSLFGRIADVINNYTDGEFVIPYALVARKPFVTAEYDIAPIAFLTSGQPINGFVGEIKYTGGITRYLPYIDLGSQIHIGKKTTRACGKYSFET